MSLKGFASQDSTNTFSEKYKEFNYNKLGKTDLFVSEAGFGSYRIDIRSSLNREALKTALLSGINLIDTSSTYTNGSSELLIGEVIEELVISNNIVRESIVIVTKGGYLQGQNFDLSQSRKKENKSFLDLVEYQKGLEHCIHPEFLEVQINKSLERLKIETIDVYLLHNPEYYLKWAKNNNIDLMDARKEYYSRIKKAFEYLEKQVQIGRIKHYGISSNTFPADANDFNFTSLETIVKIAEEVSVNNHFSVIEFPMNFAEVNAYTNVNQSNNMTLLQLAESKNLGVLINRPLNAFYNNKLILLAEPMLIQNPPTKEFIENKLKQINELEKLISKKLKNYSDKKILSEVEDYLFIFQELYNVWLNSENISNWQVALNQYFLPRLHYYSHFIKNYSLKNKELELILSDCADKISELFEQITFYYNNEHLKLTTSIKTNLSNSIPELASAKNLSSMAVRAFRSTSGISSVLVGMIQPPYVTDILDELKTPVKKKLNWNKINFNIYL